MAYTKFSVIISIIHIGARKIDHMTWEEKREFAERIISEPIQKKLKRGRRYLYSGFAWLIGGGLAIAIVLILKIFRASFFLPFALFMWVDFSLTDFFRFYTYAVKTVKRESRNRISYREYCRLKKTGELEKWLNEQIPNPLTQSGKKTLSAEEIALLKKIIDEQEKQSTNNDFF